MRGNYEIARFAVIVVSVLLLGMILGGGARLAASIVSSAGRIAFANPVISTSVIIGILIGLWFGREYTVHRLGEYEKEEYRHMIDAGGRRRNR